MAQLVNARKKGCRKLLELLGAESEATSTQGRRTFYAVSCYFDQTALLKLGRSVSAAVERGGAQLQGFHVAIDIGDWLRQRADREHLEELLANVTGLARSKVSVQPINVAGRLVHAKGYALVGPPQKTSRTRRGFVAVTSGNLTRRGLGIATNANVELVHLTRDSKALSSFRHQFRWLVQEHPPSPKKLADHQDFLLALSMFGRGSFFHKWDGSLSSEVRFTLSLTKSGKAAQASGSDPLLQDYDPGTSSLSRSPINLQRAFRRQPKPFPSHFWRTYSIDTPLGRWVPTKVAELIDNVLDEAAEPYLRAIKRLTRRSALDSAETILTDSVAALRFRGWVKETDVVVSTWRRRVEEFRKNRDLITARIYNYEHVPDLLGNAGRGLVLRTFRSTRDRLAMKPSGLSGLRRVLAEAIDYGLDDLDDELEALAVAAQRALEKHHGESE